MRHDMGLAFLLNNLGGGGGAVLENQLGLFQSLATIFLGYWYIFLLDLSFWLHRRDQV